jgi:hypothetical protein
LRRGKRRFASLVGALLARLKSMTSTLTTSGRYLRAARTQSRTFRDYALGTIWRRGVNFRRFFCDENHTQNPINRW